MHDHLTDLIMLGIFNRQSRNEGRGGGQYYEYEFNVGLKLVCEVADTLDCVALPRRIREHL
jgi:cell division control protein 6